ncbi:MAG: glycogen synthase GlgA [Deltaproteobacteria bacterium]|nr:glycogen synthase GlgA [Deltaproteobacteria bacterium]MBW1986668.1 glycogen synthase GlgA [Deltaproteobacteria bacterium]MBW2134876.1 glycogen synthase GlgA [Deltaproteobacteria bacterium]
MTKELTVLFVTPEAVPFAKTGGLADVAGTLPLALQRQGLKLQVVMPLYGMIKQGKHSLSLVAENLKAILGQNLLEFNLFTADSGGVPFYFVERDEFYERSQLYGTSRGDYFDNLERYTFLARSVLPICLALNLKPDIIHCHDWQSALVPVYLKTDWSWLEPVADSASVFTIHNLAYQGLFDRAKFPLLGLNWSLFSMDGLEYYDRINFLKGGIVYADTITTVSRQYSQEIQTPEFGYGLEGVLQSRAEVLTGIVNGVDYRDWDPATDPLLVANYDPSNLAGKAKNKKALMEKFSLEAKLAAAPLLGMISRLADQKGFDLVAEVLPQLMAQEVTLVILGTGEEKYHQLLTQEARKYPGKLGVKIAYDNALAHLIEAGADMFLMPSRYEPCGLNQIYSMKYGTIPVVRATGGLVDTVEPVDPTKGTGTGFRFKEYEPEAFLAALRQALRAYQNKSLWTKLMHNAMAQDFSWESSAKAYIELYHQTLSRKQIEIRRSS